MNRAWVRSDLKWRAKEAFRKNYWAAVIVSLILAIVISAGTGGASGEAAGSVSESYASHSYDSNVVQFGKRVTANIGSMWERMSHSPWSLIMALVGTGIMILLAVIALFFQILVGHVLEVGASRFYIENLYSAPGVGKILYGFKSGSYWNVVKIMFFKNLFIGLWSLLLIVPGIIKAYEYRMIPYLLAEYPDMPREEAFARSKEMMYGQKMNAFILDLSFVPWHILSGITFGIVGVLYSSPYIDATNAELYDVLAGGQN